MGSPVTDAPKSTPGHGGARPGAGRPPGSGGGKVGRPAKTEQNDAYTVLAKAKAKRETYRAQLAELEYKQRSGELIPADEVAAAWEDRAAIVKGRLMGLPSRVSPDLLGLTDSRAIERVVRDAVVEILEELAAEAAKHGSSGD